MSSEKPASSSKPSEPHYHGHRQRLRQRFLDAGSGAVRDYELLEVIVSIEIIQLSA
jgi:DNA repair protein RadC